MDVLSSGKLKEDTVSSITYTIVVDDFRKKLAAREVLAWNINTKERILTFWKLSTFWKLDGTQFIRV